ncbi:hypothetical protein Psch_01559 [Pelotomaculum schinkii]|uniref:Uncharacterized protein n=1 Tax=Pelotomaculum schinkii TaxID=78350 RepID=A0A4Y7RG78_9FIRM|nr:hypothetical protein Psch_01559 [Pelotomaculum schinkii]
MVQGLAYRYQPWALVLKRIDFQVARGEMVV